MHALFIETVEDDHRPVRAHEANNVFGCNNAFVERVFGEIDGILQDIDKLRNSLFHSDTGRYPSHVDIDTERHRFRRLIVHGIDLAGEHPAGKGFSRTEIAKQRKKGLVGFKRPVHDIGSGLDGVRCRSGFGFMGDGSSIGAVLDVVRTFVPRAFQVPVGEFSYRFVIAGQARKPLHISFIQIVFYPIFDLFGECIDEFCLVRPLYLFERSVLLIVIDL